jgi:hypothetical protein
MDFLIPIANYFRLCPADDLTQEHTILHVARIPGIKAERR